MMRKSCEHEPLVSCPEIEEFFVQDKTVVDYPRGNHLFRVRRLNMKGKQKYSLDMFDESGKRIGYIAFFYYPEQKELVFSGIKVEPDFRKQGMSYVLIDELSTIAQSNQLSFQRTKKQFKPLTCAVLRKKGFDPINGLHSYNRVYVGKLLDGHRESGIFFESLERAARFDGTRVQKIQRCRVVLEIDELRDAIQIVLPSRYSRGIHAHHQRVSQRPTHFQRSARHQKSLHPSHFTPK